MNEQECGIGEQGAVHLFKALQDNSTLQCLSLAGNEISSLQGAADTSSRFGLRLLDMRSNKLINIPVEFVEALRADVALDIRGNPLRDVPLQLVRLPSSRVVGSLVKITLGGTAFSLRATPACAKENEINSDEGLFQLLRGGALDKEVRVFVSCAPNVRHQWCYCAFGDSIKWLREQQAGVPGLFKVERGKRVVASTYSQPGGGEHSEHHDRGHAIGRSIDIHYCAPLVA